MNDAYKIEYQTLHAIYNKHRRKYRGNPDSKQMCCMWSTNNPPDTLLNTKLIDDIEDAFNIKIDDDEAMEIYDMTLDEAINKIMDMKGIQKDWLYNTTQGCAFSREWAILPTFNAPILDPTYVSEKLRKTTKIES